MNTFKKTSSFYEYDFDLGTCFDLNYSPTFEKERAVSERIGECINIDEDCSDESSNFGRCKLNIKTCIGDGSSQFFHDIHRGLTLRYKLYGDSNCREKIIFVMGLSCPADFWFQQVEYFQKYYQVCIFDSRGVGESTSPLERYTTSLLAVDTACLLDHLGWVADRSIHLVGISLGGMVSQELSQLISHRLLSLSLIATFAGGLGYRTLPSFMGGVTFLGCGLGAVISKQIHRYGVLKLLFTEKSLKENYEFYCEIYDRVIDVNGLNRIGGTLQSSCVLTHHLEVKKMQSMRFQPFKTLVLTGSDDILILPRNSEYLAKHLNAKLKIIEGAGHGVPIEFPHETNQTLHEFFYESEIHAKKLKT